MAGSTHGAGTDLDRGAAPVRHKPNLEKQGFFWRRGIPSALMRWPIWLPVPGLRSSAALKAIKCRPGQRFWCSILSGNLPRPTGSLRSPRGRNADPARRPKHPRARMYAKPIVIGPSMENFRQTARDFRDGGAVRQIKPRNRTGKHRSKS